MDHDELQARLREAQNDLLRSGQETTMALEGSIEWERKYNTAALEISSLRDSRQEWQRRAILQRQTLDDARRTLERVRAVCDDLHEDAPQGVLQLGQRVLSIIDLHLAPQSVVAPKLASIDGTQEVIGIVTEHFGPGVVVLVDEGE